MIDRRRNYSVFACVGILMLVCFFLVSCGRTKPTKITTSPLSPVATSLPAATVSSSAEVGQVYVAQFQGAYASGYPYPVFFFDVPKGTTTLTLRNVTYEAKEALNGVHPRLEKVLQEVAWPGSKTVQILATAFRYDESQGTLVAFNVTVDNLPLDNGVYDILASRGVGIAYLGDTGGVNIFHNCGMSTSISHQDLSTADERPTETLFKWSCGDSSYEASVKMTWSTSPGSNIRIINGLTASIIRK